MAACGIETNIGGTAPPWGGPRGFALSPLVVAAALLAAPSVAIRAARAEAPTAPPTTPPSPAATPAPAAPASRPLHAAIDAIVAEAAVGPVAAPCNDADFVRRIHLDLAGVIPTVATVRAFLADPTADKRVRLIDALLADRAFARHMMFVLDAMLLERATPPDDLAASWREYLFTNLADDTPLDALARELLVSDGAAAGTRPATAFVVTRDAEPVQLTRAVGRLFFGRDLQCAQCHDHPLDDDIRQAEHQGLYAFLARTSLFKGKDTPQFVSEKADGEVDYQSVFTNEGQKGVWPRLPGGLTLIDEPRPEPAAAYRQEPSKTAHGVPAFSRRAALAARLADDEGFRRNLANRIWAIFLGRGLVHPLDGHGSDNSPSHPRLLSLLANALRDHGFRLRPIVRGIVLSETYQRRVEPPSPAAIDAAAVGGLASRLEAERPALEAARAAADEAAAAAEARRDAAAAATHAVHLERLGLVTARDAAAKAATAADAAAAKAAAELDVARQVSDALATAAAKAVQATALVAGDGSLTDLAATLGEHATKKAAATEKAAAAHAEKQAAVTAAAAALAAARQAVDAATARLGVEALATSEREAVAARRAAVDAAHALRRLDDRLVLARDLVAFGPLAASDRVAADLAWESIVDRWTVAGQVAALRALAPEQLALSVQQATGALAARQARAAAAIDKAPPEQIAKASDDDRPVIRAMQVEMKMVNDASGLLRSAAKLFGDALSEGFQASVNQALYFGNAPDIQGQLAPSGTNLVATLATMSDAGAVADEAYMAVLSRPPTDEERADVAAFLEPRAADRPAALAEFVWALVSSNEFRFNH
jgi:hypothetical protein